MAVKEPKRNAILGVYDRPILRDWTFWWSAFWVVFMLMIELFPSPTAQPTGMPKVVEIPLIIVIMFFLLGWSVAMIRRLVRAAINRSRRSRQLRSAPQAPSAPALPTQNMGRPVGPGAPFGQDGHVSSPPVGTAQPLYGPAMYSAPAGPLPPTHASLPVGPPLVAPPVSPPTSATDSNVTPPQAHQLSAPSMMTPRVPITPLLRAVPVEQDAAFVTARENLPFPVAHACRNFVLAGDPLQRYQVMIDVAEAVNLTMGMVGLAWLNTSAPGAPVLEDLRRAYETRGVATGVWSDVTRTAANVMAKGNSGALRIDGYVEAVTSKPKGGATYLALMDRFIQERNRSAHGARPHSAAEAQVRIDEYSDDLIELLRRIDFLSNYAWLRVERCSYQHDGVFRIIAQNAMGDHPEFESRSFSSRSPLADDDFYVITPDGALPLSPYLVMRFCAICSQSEMYYADRFDKGKVILKSVSRGHTASSSELYSRFGSAGERGTA